jgi:hypothetical protein
MITGLMSNGSWLQLEGSENGESFAGSLLRFQLCRYILRSRIRIDTQ